ncbi:MAG: DNA polymerase III subunit delta [Bryobacteraceae bacterium]|nr:DNA polymerase III subunit delta [Bryobacteraceae bacterium]
MTPAQFLSKLSRQGPAPVYLFTGAEPYLRERARQALIERTLPPDEREAGFTRLDLGEAKLEDVIDDARTLSLFSPRRLIWASGAEAVLPKTISRAESESDEGAAAAVARYVRNPTPGVVLVLESNRFEYEGEGKKKLERVQKFYSAIPDQVEFAPFTADEARRLAANLARESGLALTPAQIAQVVEACGGEAARIAIEMDKLATFAAGRGSVTEEDIAKLVPNAQATTIFALVAALGRRDRAKALELLDALVRDGEYLPLALSFLGTQFRHALAAREAGLRGSQQVQAYFSRRGVPMWPSRANDVSQTASLFSESQLRTALETIYLADKALRDARPDDKTVMEAFVFALTGAA